MVLEAKIPDIRIKAKRPPISPPFNLSKLDLIKSIDRKTIDTAIMRRPDAIPPSLNAIYLVIFKFIIEHICCQVIVLITHKSSKFIIDGE